MARDAERFSETVLTYARDLQAKFNLASVVFSPEDQLKPAVSDVIYGAGLTFSKTVVTVTEVHTAEVSGRPDMGVTVNGLLAGHVELKAPGKGADTGRFKGADRDQWQRFKDLPNVIYTDGNAWALYRTGERIGGIVRLGDVTRSGADGVDREEVTNLLSLLRVFFAWQPITPSGPRSLAKTLAPLCRLLRADVLGALGDPESNLSSLATDWRRVLFPDADDAQFADAYAQTLTYALLLARLSGADDLRISEAADSLRSGHRLLSDALRVLGDEQAREAISIPVDLIERVITAVDVDTLTRHATGDPWLYFYEDFLAAYDLHLRKSRGVYYTPVQVVQAQVRLVGELLETRFGRPYSFVNEDVVTLDPAAGTGTYVFAAIQHGLDKISSARGPGIRVSAATRAARNIHAFELLVGPYAVAHLRLTQQIMAEGGTLPPEGVHVYLTDTLESPHAEAPGYLPLSLKPLGEEHKRAQRVKADTQVLVCIGNPPYDRQTLDNSGQENRKGGWIRFGDKGVDGAGILDDFIEPLREANLTVHAKNLYNDYVYFWRWALWKVFEPDDKPGIVSFITASSYLRGAAFAGMRKVMRSMLDELWIIDLEGGTLGARHTENVFAIQTPVAIAIGVRYGAAQPSEPALVRYTKIEGTQEAKLTALASVESFESLNWRNASPGWLDSFLPEIESPFAEWPLLTDLFPWQENGVKVGRTWPIAVKTEVLRQRWEHLLAGADRRKLFKDSPTGRKADRGAPHLSGGMAEDLPITLLPKTAPLPPLARYAYRSFDRQWLIADSRVIDRPSPALWEVHGEGQVYLTSLLTEVMSEGPAAVATALIPDLHHFRGSFGGAHVIPLWRNREATAANITSGCLSVVSDRLGCVVTATDFFAYCYGVLSAPDYVTRFWEELFQPGPRIPITTDLSLFKEMTSHGRELLFIHTFGDRFSSEGQTFSAPQARCAHGTSSEQTRYPDDFTYTEATRTLRVGDGVFEGVAPQMWEFSVSGLQIIESWLLYRMKAPKGKTSSELDEIRPTSWSFDDELLELLWTIERTIALLPKLRSSLDRILQSSVLKASDLPLPFAEERVDPITIASRGKRPTTRQRRERRRYGDKSTDPLFSSKKGQGSDS